MKNMTLGVAALLCIGLLAAFSYQSNSTTAPGTEQEFQTFLKQFPLAHLPYELSAATLKDNMMAGLRLDDDRDPLDVQELVIPERKSVDDPKGFIPGSRASKMSRVPLFDEPVSRVETEQYVGVIYNQSRGYNHLYNAYWIAVFDKKGILMANNLIASTSRTAITSTRIDEQLIAHSETYKIHWKNDLNQNGTLGNEITGLGRDSATEIDLKKPAEAPQKKKNKPAAKREPVVQQSGAK
ncbi:MAG: hypothetical protein IT260_18690 [Saprospiraceae bacterium]|nr:hypothetical protein [Saprospiraceae bacterium]